MTGSKPKLALGLISGTSQDGIDAVVAEFDGDRWLGLRAQHAGYYPPALRERLLQLSREQTPVSLHDFADLDRQVAEAFASTALELLDQAALRARDIAVLGSHGQTVFHDPEGVRSSLQLGDPSLIATRTGITTVADFRRKDVALGGQGAPLVPAFHQALFATPAEKRAVLNIGGIANLTLLPASAAEPVRGFDSGPGNALMDEWCEQHLGQPYDQDGHWAASGQINEALLQRLLADPYYALAPPKSTGRGRYRMEALVVSLPEIVRLPAADVQRTLCELTALTAVQALQKEAPDTRRLLVCGGGARNRFLMERLGQLASGCSVESTEAWGLHADWVEAAAFAWLAVRRVLELPGNLPAVTGASRATTLGGVFLP